MTLIKLLLSAENLKLSKFEAETLFRTKFKLKGKFASATISISEKKLLALCESSAMIKRAYVNDQKVWRFTQGRFVAREPQKKPKFHPAMLRPKLARLLINLSGAKKTLLDPFCGTGSILIEAAILGLKPTGSDIERKQVWYSMKNLEHYKLKAKLSQQDATELKYKTKFDAIVTDPPYGRSSTLAGKKVKDIYEKFFISSLQILKPKARVVLMYPSKLRFKIPKKLQKLASFDWYVHRSLTRRIIVLALA